ncbi:MAG: citrate (Si)-synthase, eukaryotic [Candidatus Hydrothermales bacterium]
MLKERLREKIEKRVKEVKEFREKYGNRVISEVTVDQAYGGMRDVKCMVWEGSLLDPNEGIRFRGYTIPEVREKLPKAKGFNEPLPEGIFYLLLIGEFPTEEDIKEIQDEFKKRMDLPSYVVEMMKKMPSDTHPMTLFSMGILAMQRESKFTKAYWEGIPKAKYWEYFYEDTLDLLAKVPVVAAYVYRYLYRGGNFIDPKPELDWAANLAYMMGYENPEVYELMRLYMVLHCDHEGGNVSAHTGHLVSSALSDVYYSISAALNGLAGPLHGLANQEVLRWILNLKEKFKDQPITKEVLEKYCWDTINSGQVIPGYGHAVLRKTDPRYIAFREFALKYMPDDEIFKIVSMLYEVVPPILQQLQKVKDPWPNVDAHSGCVLYHYGITEFPFYTVLFGVSRAIGITVQLIWDRALGLPIERPKSVTLEWLKENVK